MVLGAMIANAHRSRLNNVGRIRRNLRSAKKIWAETFRFYNNDWSPEQIPGTLELRRIFVSHETIYRRIYAEIKERKWR